MRSVIWFRFRMEMQRRFFVFILLFRPFNVLILRQVMSEHRTLDKRFHAVDLDP